MCKAGRGEGGRVVEWVGGGVKLAEVREGGGVGGGWSGWRVCKAGRGEGGRVV